MRLSETTRQPIDDEAIGRIREEDRISRILEENVYRLKPKRNGYVVVEPLGGGVRSFDHWLSCRNTLSAARLTLYRPARPDATAAMSSGVSSVRFVRGIRRREGASGTRCLRFFGRARGDAGVIRDSSFR